MKNCCIALLLFIAGMPALAQEQPGYPTVAETRAKLLRLLSAHKAGTVTPNNLSAIRLFPGDSSIMYGTGKGTHYIEYLAKNLKRGEAQLAFGKWKQLLSAAIPEYETGINPVISKQPDYFTKYYVSRGPDSMCITLATVSGWKVLLSVSRISWLEAEGIARARKVPADETAVTVANATGKPDITDILLDKDGIVKRNQQNGFGRIAFKNGEWLDGELKDGKPEYGDYHYTNGDVYHGSFKNGLPSGLGSLVKASGTEYLGMFQNGVLDMQSAGIKNAQGKYDLAVPASARTSSTGSSTSGSYSSTPAASKPASAGQLSPEQQKVIDQYNDNMNPQARRAREASEALSRRIAEQGRRINNDYRTTYDRAQQRSQEQTQQNIDARNREQERLNKQFNEKYNR